MDQLRELDKMIVARETTSATCRRHQNEIRHGRQIARNAETVWGWNRPTGPARLKRRMGLMARSAGLQPGRTVLELGCGTGLTTQHLARNGARIVALDLSPDLLEVARKRGLPSNVALELGNAEALEFPPDTFDAVVGSSVLHHLSLRQVLGEILRVLRPGGRIAFSEPNMLNPHIFVQKNVPWHKRLAGDTPDETAYVRWPLSSQLYASGFQQVVVTPYDFLHPLVPVPLVPLMSRVSDLLEKAPLLREIAGSLLIGAKKPVTG